MTPTRAFGLKPWGKSVLAAVWILGTGPAGGPAFAQELALENGQLRWVLDGAGRTVALIGKATGRDYAAAPPAPMASVTLADQRTLPVSTARLAEGVLTLEFDSPEVTARLKVEERPEVLTLEVLELVAPSPVHSFTFLQLPVTITAHLGSMMNVAWDDHYGIIGLGLTLKTLAAASRQEKASLLSARGFPKFGFQGCKVGLVGAPTPQLRLAIHRAAQATGLPAPEFEGGKPIHLTEENRKSYLFTNVSEANVGRCIEYARALHFGQIMMFQGSWAKTSGHFELNTAAYPHGEAGLKATVDQIRAAGLKAGFHLWASKMHKSDPYCTPVPDPRIWKKAQVTLAEAIDERADRILTREPPRGFYGEKPEVSATWKEIQIGDEIIAYEALSLQAPYGFSGCKRGANGTRAAAHPAGAIVYQPGIDDTCPGYIIDQDTSLLDETSDRCAGLLNRVGCDMIYFDGGEDVPDPYWYYVPNFELAVWKRLVDKPIILQGTIVQHHSWHIFSRNSTVDIRREQSKEHVDNSVKYLLSHRENLLPGELGWYGIFPRTADHPGTQFDEVDYLCCKALAYDAPFSIEMGLESLESHLLWPEMVRQIGFYEDLRLRRYFPPEALEPLKQPQQDFTLFHEGQADEKEGWHLLPLREVQNRPDRDLHLFLGEWKGNPVAYFWNAFGESDLTLPRPPRLQGAGQQGEGDATSSKTEPVPSLAKGGACRLVDDLGRPVELEMTTEGLRLPLLPVRRFLICEGWTAEEVEWAFRQAQVTRRATGTLYLQAESGRLFGRMVRGQEVPLREPEALGDVVTFLGVPDSRQQFLKDYAEYTVELPSRGVYAIWARLRYPRGGDMSFSLVEEGAPYTGEMAQALGNSGGAGDRWHWDSQGSGTASRPGQGRRLIHVQGKVLKFRIHPREGAGGQDNPRLDALCITNDLTYVPNDEEARKALEGK